MRARNMCSVRSLFCSINLFDRRHRDSRRRGGSLGVVSALSIPVDGCRSPYRLVPRRISLSKETPPLLSSRVEADLCIRFLGVLARKEKRIPEIAGYAQKVNERQQQRRDRQLTVFGAAIYPCRAIEVIAVSVVNSGPNNPAIRVSFSSSLVLRLTFSIFPAFSGQAHSEDRRTLPTSVFRGLREHRSSP